MLFSEFSIYLLNIPISIVLACLCLLFEKNGLETDLLLFFYGFSSLIVFIFSLTALCFILLVFLLINRQNRSIFGYFPLLYRLFLTCFYIILIPTTFPIIIEMEFSFSFCFLIFEWSFLVILGGRIFCEIISNRTTSNYLLELESQKSLYSLDDQELARIDLEVFSARQKFNGNL